MGDASLFYEEPEDDMASAPDVKGEMIEKEETQAQARHEVIIKEMARAEGYTAGLRVADRAQFHAGILAGLIIEFVITLGTIILLRVGGLL